MIHGAQGGGAITKSGRKAAVAMSVVALCWGVSGIPGQAAAPRASQAGQAGLSFTVKGVTFTASQLRARHAPPAAATHQASPRRTIGRAATRRPSPTANPARAARSVSASSAIPQTQSDEILGPTVLNGQSVPPDTMGAVGATQFLFSVNGWFRGTDKNPPHNTVFDISQTAFWGSVANAAGVSDGHVRYDEPTHRWFITEIDVPSSANGLLLAVSSTADLSTTSWTLFRIPATGASAATDQGCFADYDTPGIDQNGIYIGANMFGGNVAACPGQSYLHSNLYAIQKSSALTSTLNVTSFFRVATGIFAIETIQGVDSIDAMTTGYAIAVKTDESPSSHLNVWQINNPSTTTPTLSGPTTISISPENGTTQGVLTLNNVNSTSPTRKMDDIDDRLFAAEIRNGHLFTAHNVAVDSTGNSNAVSRTRDAARWYDINVSGLTLNQSGTVFDSASSGFQNFWMPSIAVSGQGHAVMGMNEANSTTAVQAGEVGRLSGDPSGTMSAFSTFQASSTNAYTDASFNPNAVNRWGDYTFTSLDPCDDQTLWTTQEFVMATVVNPPAGWQVAAEKLLAPPPATPSSASPSSVPAGQASLNVIVSGTSTGGSGFYDTPSSMTDPCRKRITASVSGGVTVNSVTYTDPTHVTLNVSTIGASNGPHNVTITNPDGQSSTASILSTTAPAFVSGAVGTDGGLWVYHSTGFTPLGGVVLGVAIAAIPQSGTIARAIYVATGSDHSLYVRDDTQAWQLLSGNPTFCIDNPAVAVIGGTMYFACEGNDTGLWHAETPVPAGSGLPALSPSSWHKLGGSLAAGPAIASVAGVPTYFVLGTDGHIYARTASTPYSGFSWSCIGHPAVATFNTTSYFACHGTDGSLYYATNSGSGWSAAQSLGGGLVDGVGIAATATGPVFFVEGTDGAEYTRTLGTGWTLIGGQVTHGLAACAL